MTDKNKHIDKMIQENLSIEEPSLGFSNKVMDQIFASDLKKERALSSLMQKHTLEEPSFDFTAGVLSNIEQKTVVETYQPVLGKKAWFLIGSLLTFIIVFTVLKADSSSNKYAAIGEMYSKFLDSLKFEFPTLAISPLFALSIFALSSLLFLDYFLRNRRLS